MRKLALTLVAALVAGLGVITPALAPHAAAATNPKVAIIVGATHDSTSRYRSIADGIAAVAQRYTTNVVKVYSPKATWTKVKAAVNGASVIVYLGHGNGWPSPYTYDPNYTTKDGFGLNYDVNGNGSLSDYEVKYYGEPSIRTLTPAKNAVVLLFHLCYASGNSEPGHEPPTLSTAKKRVDNYGAAFIKAGARAVIADGHGDGGYYMDALFTTKQTIDQLWRGSRNFNNNVRTYDSVRNPGYTYQLDPESSTSYYRSIVGKMSLTTTQVTGASYASTDTDPLDFVVPGNASPKLDGAPVYGSVETATQGLDPWTSLLASDRVRIDWREWATAWDGSAIFRVHTDSGVEGWMTGSTLTPRDSTPPRLWGWDAGVGVFSPNGDGRQDSITIDYELSESTSWRVRFTDGGDHVYKSFEGTGSTASVTWAPAAGSLDDGTYTWELEASDAWGNGPLQEQGTIEVDTTAPELSMTDAEGETVPWFAPNGDGYRETIGFAGGSTEAGWLTGTAIDEDGDAVDSTSVKLSGGGATLTWDGKTADGYAPDGRYTLRIRAKDLAGNLSDAAERTVDVYGSLRSVASSRTIFYPQDGDSLAKTTTFSFALASPATVTWTVIDAKGALVRTLATDEAMDAGSHAIAWDGRNDAGAFVPRGTYRTQVVATDGTRVATQRASVVADAFRFVVSDSTPARGQKLTVTIVTPELMDGLPRLSVYQPGIDRYTVKTTKVGTYTYRVTVTLKSSKTGTLKLRAYGYDANGQKQASYLYLPLH